MGQLQQETALPIWTCVNIDSLQLACTLTSIMLLGRFCMANCVEVLASRFRRDHVASSERHVHAAIPRLHRCCEVLEVRLMRGISSASTNHHLADLQITVPRLVVVCRIHDLLWPVVCEG